MPLLLFFFGGACVFSGGNFSICYDVGCGLPISLSYISVAGPFGGCSALSAASATGVNISLGVPGFLLSPSVDNIVALPPGLTNCSANSNAGFPGLGLSYESERERAREKEIVGVGVESGVLVTVSSLALQALLPLVSGKPAWFADGG